MFYDEKSGTEKQKSLDLHPGEPERAKSRRQNSLANNDEYWKLLEQTQSKQSGKYCEQEDSGKLSQTSALPDKKTKRSFNPWITLAILLLVVLVGYITIHFPTDATCTDASVCRICGKLMGNALGHNLTEATYDLPSTCRTCGKTTGHEKGYIGYVSGYYSDQGVNLGYHYGIPCYVLDEPIKNCRQLTIALFLGEAIDGTPLGNWEFYVKTTDGKWTSIGIVDIQAYTTFNKFFFETPISFTEVAATRLSTSPATHTMGYEISKVQVYTD